MVTDLPRPPQDGTAEVGYLIENGTTDARTAALFWLAAEYAASIVVVARPRLAGKTTHLNTFLRFTRPGTTFRAIQGGDDLYDPRSVPSSPQHYLVCNEFSPAPVPTYVWGPKVREVFEAASNGHPIAATMHAESLEEVAGLLTEPPNSVPPALLAQLHLFVFIRVLPSALGQEPLRRIAEVRQITGVERDGHLRSAALVTWDRERDTFQHHDLPDLLAPVVPAPSGERGAIRREIERRAQVLQSAVGRGIRGGAALAELVSAYRADPEGTASRWA